MAIMGAGLLFCGIYCLKMTNESEHGLLCLLIGVVTLLSGIVLPVVAIVGAFNEEEVRQAITCIVLYTLSIVGGIVFAKKLWY